MKIGIAAATSFEITPLYPFIRQYEGGNCTFQVLVTGIGSMAATYQLTRYVTSQHPDYVLQAGIGGSFSPKYQPGDVVLIGEEIMGDLGVVEKDGFHDIFDLGLQNASTKPFDNKRLKNPYLQAWQQYGLPVANGVTVNEISTVPERITLLQQKYNCDIESMEGAALHYVCLQQEVPFMQIRAVSNYVGERNKSNWKLTESIRHLNDAMMDVIRNIAKQ